MYKEPNIGPNRRHKSLKNKTAGPRNEDELEGHSEKASV